MYKKFASLAHSKEYAYAFDSSVFDTKAQVVDHFRMFHTYGDGLTAHSPDWGITTDFMADYLASLSVAMLADEELLQAASFELQRRPSVKEIEFAHSVRFREADRVAGRTRFYSIKERKMAGDTKRNDRRYEEVRDWMDGSPKAIYRLLIPSYRDGLTMYAYAHAIRDWEFARENGDYMALPVEFLEWFKDDKDQRDKAQHLHNAFELALSVVEAYQAAHRSQVMIENYKRQWGPKDPTPTSQETEAA